MQVIDKILLFLRKIEKLKTIERFNKTSNLGRAESDAEHSWHLAMMVYLLARFRPDLNRGKLVEIALIHDLVEIGAGDVNALEGRKKSRELKRQDEENAAINLFSLLPNIEAKRLMNLWLEYERKSSPEALFVYASDKLQPFLQRLVSGDDGWKKKKVTLKKLLFSIYPSEVKRDKTLSEIWDKLTKEAVGRNMLADD